MARLRAGLVHDELDVSGRRSRDRTRHLDVCNKVCGQAARCLLRRDGHLHSVDEAGALTVARIARARDEDVVLLRDLLRRGVDGRAAPFRLKHVRSQLAISGQVCVEPELARKLIDHVGDYGVTPDDTLGVHDRPEVALDVVEARRVDVCRRPVSRLPDVLDETCDDVDDVGVHRRAIAADALHAERRPDLRCRLTELYK